MNFEELWSFTDSIPGSFTKLSAEKLFEYASRVERNGTIAEIGVDQGRSLSVLLNARRGNPTLFVLVDSWESVLIDNMDKVKKLLAGTPNYMLLNMTSVDAAVGWHGHLDMIHIDAHHHDDTDKGGPTLDCEWWLPKLKIGGVACFHDYYPSWPDVTAAVDKYCAGWENLGDWDSLAIRRKP